MKITIEKNDPELEQQTVNSQPYGLVEYLDRGGQWRLGVVAYHTLIPGKDFEKGEVKNLVDIEFPKTTFSGACKFCFRPITGTITIEL